MPIRQPGQTAIHTSNFQKKTYSFVVESVLAPQERVGMLTVSISAGYLLTTPLNKELKRELAFEHIQQTDGSWIAEGIVTVFVTDDFPIDGKIVIRNSLDETIILPIIATSVTIVKAQHPLLSINQSALTFPQTSPGKPSFLVLTIAQQDNGIPVTLTTDSPEYFRLASDSRPAFLPTLTLTPSSTGTYVHVQYFASKNGLHTGQLIIETGYEQKLVALEGRSSGLLPTLRRPRTISNQAVLPKPNRKRVSKGLVSFFFLVIISGLSYAGYTNRCQLFPALCNETASGQIRKQETISLPITAVANTSLIKKVALNTAILKKTKNQTKKASTQARRSRLKYLLVKQDADQVPANERSAEFQIRSSRVPKKLNSQNVAEDIRPKSNRRVTPASVTEESELERTLNQKQNL